MSGTASTPCASWAEVSRDALRHNIDQMRRLAGPGVAVLVAVKANAYGHGAVESACEFVRAGAAMLGVAQVGEALELRDADVDAPILILGPPLPEQIPDIHQARAACVVADPDWVHAVAPAVAGLDPPVPVHLKVDTGMGRVGVLPDGAMDLAMEILATPGLALEGLCTHFATSDEADRSFADQQLDLFQQVVKRIRGWGIKPRWVHAANSAANMVMPDSHLDMVRCGISAYGLYSSHEMPRPCVLRPALTWKSRLTSVKEIPAGHSVGYGRQFVADKPTRVALVPVGYADGYDRRLSNRGTMQLHGRDVPVVGRVSMDQTAVDVTHVPEARAGDVVVVYSNDPDAPNGVENTARLLGTIPHDVTCAIGRRVPRQFV